VWIAVNEAEKRGRQRNNALFEEIGKKVNPPIGRGLAREYFDSVERRMGRKSSKPTHASIGDHPLLHRPIRRK
jgi:hypothetical protein